AGAAIRITIPVGQYRALIERQPIKAPAFKNHYLLAMKPVRAISIEREASHFAEGFSEELAHRLFVEFGSQVVSPTFSDQSATDGTASHWLEGSVRIVGDRLRATFRLVDAKVGSIAWSAQFDRTACMSMGGEEHLANEVCAAVRNYYCQG
ncbi:MAG: hypothetical protein M3N23_04210, partial [Pseudomonadota bacterium]|nr:hypothetical protein [Pseudomonadota bacterium]